MIFSPTNYATVKTTDAALQQIREQVVPYGQYYWRRRPTANSYVEGRQTAYSAGVGYNHTSNSKDYYYLDAKRYVRYSDEEEGTNYFATLKYASSITINQSTGAISLNNPSTHTFTSSDNVYESATYGRFQGKYVQGFLGIESTTFYIPTSAYMTGHNWENSGGDKWNEEGYEVTSDMGDTLMPMLISTTKNTTTGAWEMISADVSDAYPTSGTSGGYDWAFLGRISDATVLLPDTARAQWQEITLTSANFSNNIANVAIKAKSALITVNCTGARGSAFGVLDVANGVFYGIYIDDEAYSQDRKAAAGTVSGEYGYILLHYYASSNGTRLYMVNGGLKITAVDSSTHQVKINWLPLDSLEVGR